MMTEKARRAQGARTSPARPDAGRQPDGGSTAGRGAGRYWIKIQGETAELVEGSERPSTDVEEGERSIELEGPYQDHETAANRLERMTKGRNGLRLERLKGADRA